MQLYEESLRILSNLVEQALGFAQWLKDKQEVEEQLAQCRARLSQPKDGER